MPLTYSQGKLCEHIYEWGRGDRPNRPVDVGRDLVARFLASSYAQNTTLAEFIRSQPNAMEGGVINQLHRRHVISWNRIQRFIAACAGLPTESASYSTTNLSDVFCYFCINKKSIDEAFRLKHGCDRAKVFESLANYMCWNVNNLFIGPSSGNIGVEIDLARDVTEAEAKDLLAGNAWRSLEIVNRTINGFCDARTNRVQGVQTRSQAAPP